VAGRAGQPDRVVHVTQAVAGPSGSETPFPTATRTPTPTPTPMGPSDTASLASLVLPSPAGYLRTRDAALPLATLAKQFMEPTQVTTDLTSDGYMQGIEIEYGTSTRAVDVQLWRFTADTGAVDFGNEYQLSNQPGTVISAVAPAPGTPGAHLFTFAKPDSKGYGVVVGVVVRGRIVIRIRSAQADGVRTVGALPAELAQQYARLPVGSSVA
jgi:hypothetical protein